MNLFPSARLTLKSERLVRVAAGLTCASERVIALCDQVLAVSRDREDFLFGASCLNNDGVPLQLCLSSGPNGTSLRLIGDPGAHLAEPEARFRSAQDALRNSLVASGSIALAELAMSTFFRLIPDEKAERSQYKNGFMWHAVSPDQPGLAFYIETAPMSQIEGWSAALDWLGDILPSAQSAEAMITPLREHCVVASMGLEGSEPQNARAKIYFRLKEKMSLNKLGIDLLNSGEFDRYLRLAMGDFEVDRYGLVLCIGFSIATGEFTDVKIDLCGHCLKYEREQWIRLIDQLVAEFGLACPTHSDVLRDGSCRVAFIGFGLDVDRRPRLNVYLMDAKARTPEAAEIEAALKDAVRYLCALQRENGQWGDYQLPVGESNEWITAYVALALAKYGGRTGSSLALDAASAAMDWLCTDRSYLAGWGYNSRTGPDSDSTAMSIALHRELGRSVRSEDQAFLRELWRIDGGIATYDGPGAWGCVHWDVTPLAYIGLGEEDQHALRASFLRGLGENLMADGMWRAYWWRNPYYGTLLTLEVLDKLGLPDPGIDAERPDSIEVDNSFDLSCLIGIEALRGASAERLNPLVDSLLAWQNQDGRWPGSPNLRVTENTCYAPWDEPDGTYYTDHAATISTATVIRVLNELLGQHDYGAAEAVNLRR